MWSSMLLTLSLLASPPAVSQPSPDQVAQTNARAAIQRSIGWLQTDAEKWHVKAQCASCHQGAMTVVALSEARKQGYAVDEKVLADNLTWTKERFLPAVIEGDQVEPEKRAEIVSLSLPLLTLALPSNPSVFSRDEIERLTRLVVNRQQPDGGWVLQPRPPAPVFDSRETLTMWFYLGLEPGTAKDAKAAAAAKASRELAWKWLDSQPAADSTQHYALRLLSASRGGANSRERRRLIDELLRRQSADGGWPQTPELTSDAYATGQALYVLSLAGVKRDRKEIRRAVEFLVSTQLEDGTWKMIARSTPAREATTNPWPLSCFGAAWATMGLVRSLPPVD